MEIKGSTSTATNISSLKKELDETACPICMEHPHNAVLLLCSSHEKGCRSYICDTSYRHSNCLDRFKKLKTNSPESVPQPSPSLVENADGGRLGQGPPQALPSEPFSGSQGMRDDLVETIDDSNYEVILRRTAMELSEILGEDNVNQGPDSHQQAHEGTIGHQEDSGVANAAESNFLNCPLCRGSVLGWMIVKEARQYLDMKPRSCSRESCSFSGTYGELRRHARRVHPATRPGDVDPSRQRAWSRLEHQREYGDIVSAIRSAMPGAIVLGDYVIDNGDGSSRDREGPGSGEGGGPWWTTFFLFQMISSPSRPLDESRGSSRTWRTHRRPSGAHRNLWGENLLGLQDDDDDTNFDEDVPRPRRRRRFMRSRHDDEEHQ